MKQTNFSCTCGAVNGTLKTLDRNFFNRVVCGCRGCRTFPLFLGRPEFLDSNGGTEILQTSAGQVSLDRGIEQLQAVQQTPKGVTRFYAKCCSTPLINAVNHPGMPMLGIMRKVLDLTDQQMGPIRARVMHTNPNDNSSSFEIALTMARTLKLLIAWRLKGEHLRSPLFDRSSQAQARLICPVERWSPEKFRQKSAEA